VSLPPKQMIDDDGDGDPHSHASVA
jgi:hypothetical protein